MVIGYVFANKTEHNVHFHQNALAFSADLHSVEYICVRSEITLLGSSIFSPGRAAPGRAGLRRDGSGEEVPLWHGMAWHGMAWRGVAWHGVAT